MRPPPLPNETRIVWTTDIHLNFVDAETLLGFCQSLRDAQAAAVVISGDISEGNRVTRDLAELSRLIERPILFVLGNHDFYRAGLDQVRREVGYFTRDHRGLRWLTDFGPVGLGPDVAVIGHDGWADGRLGDYNRSKLMLNDYLLIQEFSDLYINRGIDAEDQVKRDRLELLHRLGDQAAAALETKLHDALDHFRRIVLVTHVPPYRQACWHRGRIAEEEWLPHFGCRAVGDMIDRVMADHPDHRLTVLCGHVHSEGEYRPRPNVRVLTGGATYGAPRINGLFDLSGF